MLLTLNIDFIFIFSALPAILWGAMYPCAFLCRSLFIYICTSYNTIFYFSNGVHPTRFYSWSAKMTFNIIILGERPMTFYFHHTICLSLFFFLIFFIFFYKVLESFLRFFFWYFNFSHLMHETPRGRKKFHWVGHLSTFLIKVLQLNRLINEP